MKPKESYKPGKKDLCQTPGYALDPLYYVLDSDLAVWECASGEGYLSRELEKYFKKVYSTDILKGVDFLTYTPEWDYDVIITNPPYSEIKYKFIERCYEIEKPWFLLMPLETAGSGRAQGFFRKYGVNIILLSKRINFKMPDMGWDGSGSQFPTAWFWWDGEVFDRINYYNYNYLDKGYRKRYEYNK